MNEYTYLSTDFHDVIGETLRATQIGCSELTLFGCSELTLWFDNFKFEFVNYTQIGVIPNDFDENVGKKLTGVSLEFEKKRVKVSLFFTRAFSFIFYCDDFDCVHEIGFLKKKIS